MELKTKLPLLEKKIKTIDDRLKSSEKAVTVTIQTSIRRKDGKVQPRTSVSFTVNDTTPQELGDFIAKVIENA